MKSLTEIRNMDDEELKRYLRSISRKKSDRCIVCNAECSKIIKITNNETFQTKILCGICNKDYEKLLKFLGAVPLVWEE